MKRASQPLSCSANTDEKKRAFDFFFFNRKRTAQRYVLYELESESRTTTTTTTTAAVDKRRQTPPSSRLQPPQNPFENLLQPLDLKSRLSNILIERERLRESREGGSACSSLPLINVVSLEEGEERTYRNRANDPERPPNAYTTPSPPIPSHLYLRNLLRTSSVSC
jgi:hypothetical protein